MRFLCVFALLIQISTQESTGVDPATANGENKISGVNFIYFFGPPPNSEQIRSVREILKNDVDEMSKVTNVNPVIRYLVSPKLREEKLEGEMNQSAPPHNHIGLLRKRRSASPTYKKGYQGGGGGCCSSCGQCGGGCGGGGCGGGQSGSYSQSSSYSSSSSGSYNSYGKKK